MGNEYWKQYIYDFISCWLDDRFDNITEEQVKEAVNNLLNDDQLWSTIDQTALFYLDKIVEAKNG